MIEKNAWQLNYKAATHPLQDVEEPNLFRDMFPYDEVPKTIFDGEVVDVKPARELLITDTTFRDGQQARTPFTVEQQIGTEHLKIN